MLTITMKKSGLTIHFIFGRNEPKIDIKDIKYNLMKVF